MNRYALGLATLIAGLAAPALASAAEVTPFTPAAFTAAQKAGEPILVEITAPWCPTCKAQKPILGKLEAQPQFKALHVFEVDFDSQKDVVRGFNARAQSTLIAFKGTQEVARSVGDTQPDSIGELVGKSI